MKKFLSYLFKIFTFCIVVLSVLLCTAFGLLQTDWCKGRLSDFITEKVKEQGATVKLGKIHGVPPFKWTIDEISIQMEEGGTLELENVKLRIALWPLLQKKLTISYLSIENATYTFSKPSFTWQKMQEAPSFAPKLKSLPFSFASRHIRVRTLQVNNTATHETLSVSIQGKAKIKQDLSEILLLLQIAGKDSSPISTKIFIDGDEKKNSLEARVDLKLPSTKMLQPFISLPFDGAFDFKSSLKGSWTTWKSLALGKKSEETPLQVALTGVVNHLTVPSAAVLDSSWKVQGAFLIYPDLSLNCKKLSLKSSFIELVSKFAFDKQHDLTKLSSVFVLSDLSHFSPYAHAPLGGDLKGKIKWRKSLVKASLTSSNLQIDTSRYNDTKISLSAVKEQNKWKGCYDGNLTSDLISIKLGGDFLKDTQILSFPNLYASAFDARLDGDLEYDIHKDWLQGDVFLSAPSLRSFRPLLPEESNLDGSLGGEVHFATALKKERTDTLPDLRAHVLMKNVRYFDKLVSQAMLDVKVHNLFTIPEGSLGIECENVLYKDIYFSKLQLKTEENGTKHPFEIYASGAWKEDMYLSATGHWKKRGFQWDIDVESFTGELLRKPFSLESPFSVHGNTNFFSVDSLFINIADGKFFFDAKLDAKTTKISTKAEHLPLDVLTITHPGFRLYGSTSFDGMLEASPEKRAGYLNVALEQADVLQQGKEEQLKAKGTLQAHLENNKVQIFSHIYATNQQFLDFSATLPIEYNFSPFKLALNKKEQVSAELTTEGELEAIFDFINIGSHKAKGLVTCHLFLSKTLDAPSLQGQIDVQNGSYENYITGMRLKKVSAKVEAANDKLLLTEFSSEGKDGGTLLATGSMNLSPKDNFPFSVQAQLQDLLLLDFDMISTEFTGALDVSGNMAAAVVKGNVIVPKATINIGENLPLEVPELDITYVNRPIHLQGSTLISPKTYPLNYDVNIIADDNVFVRGKGLSSEWKGAVHLTGKNAAVAAEGTLTLLKGDFNFSGKQFTLTQGEITFNDKPTPSAFIKISGNLQMSDVQVLAVMQGPLSSPTLTFQSIPHMPTSSILARILFNKDISEITAIQALQLANVIVSMSGSGGPDVLEAIRRSIGVDRLTIVGKDGSDEISLQIGWYLTHGVTVSLSQSATSSDVTIEVDLKHGFIFQAETQNQEEGKFSLKWNKNY